MEAKQTLVGLRSLWQKISDCGYRDIEDFKAEITEDEYWEMLEILPPLKMNNGTFYMCEFQTGDVTTKYWKDNGKFFAQVVDFRKEFPKMTDHEYDLIRGGCY